MSFEFLKIEQSVYGEDVSLVGLELEDVLAPRASHLGGVSGDEFIHVSLLDFDGDHLADFVGGHFDE